jgi:hypothetical protein
MWKPQRLTMLWASMDLHFLPMWFKRKFLLLNVLYRLKVFDIDLKLAKAGQLRSQSLSPRGVKNFHFSISSRPALGPIQPLIQWLLGALSPEVKRPDCEADHSPLTSAEVKKMLIVLVIYLHHIGWIKDTDVLVHTRQELHVNPPS